MKKTMNRRKFIQVTSTSALGAGLVLKSGCSVKGKNKVQVIEVVHPGAVTQGRKIDQDKVRGMVQKGMRALTGTERYWSKFIKPEDRVGLKINTLGRPVLYTHHELIQAVIEELTDYGVKENNIIVWDRYESHMVKCDFEINATGEGVQVYGTETLEEGQNHFDTNLVFPSELDNPERRKKDFGTDSAFSKIFTQECDKIINLAILKDHRLSAVTLCLKNLAYGLSDNNSRFHGPEHIGPFISDFCNHPLVKKKVVLHMIDGLEGCFDKGPAPGTEDVLFTPNTLWLGTDPVALDAVGFKVIEKKRKEKGLPSFEEAGRPIDHIEMAAEKGVGISNLDQIAIKSIHLT